MKRTLKELELNIPTISLLETRKITGGYDGGTEIQYIPMMAGGMALQEKRIIRMKFLM